jgi:hypothetical protein
MTDADVDDLSWAQFPAFDERAMKRAIRRGVIRTAALGAAIFFVASVVVFVGASGLRLALGNSHELDRVASVGWRVAHPNFKADQSASSQGGWTSSYTIGASPLLAEPSGATTPVRLTENPWGRVSAPFAQIKAPSDDALANFGSATSSGAAVKDHERAVLSQLPSPVTVAAVVELSTPMDDAAWMSFAQERPNSGLNDTTPVLLSRASRQFEVSNAHLISSVYGWSWTYNIPNSFGPAAGPVTQFRKWVATLHNSDRDTLAAVGAGLNGLRAASKDGHIYGFIVSQANVSWLLDLLKDPAVGAVHPYDVAFNVAS